MTGKIDKIYGSVVSGLGKGALFTELDWAKKQFIEKLGIDPFPGTLNIRLTEDRIISRWQATRKFVTSTIHAGDDSSCDAHCYAIKIADRYTAAAVVPLVENYPVDQIEIIAPLALRQTLSLQDGDLLEFEHKLKLSASTIIFDLDGTLLDTIEAFYVLAKRTGDEFGIEMNRAGVYDLLNYGKPYWEPALAGSSVDRQAMVEKLNARAVQLWPEVMRDHARVFPGIRETLLTLKQMGHTLAIVTGSGQTSLELLYTSGVRDLFDAVIGGADVSKRKPDPEGLNKCLQRLHVKAEDAVYVGDTSIDMQASRSAGILAIGVLSGAGSSALLCEDGAHRIIHDHSALIELFEKR